MEILYFCNVNFRILEKWSIELLWSCLLLNVFKKNATKQNQILLFLLMHYHFTPFSLPSSMSISLSLLLSLSHYLYILHKAKSLIRIHILITNIRTNIHFYNLNESSFWISLSFSIYTKLYIIHKHIFLILNPVSWLKTHIATIKRFFILSLSYSLESVHSFISAATMQREENARYTNINKFACKWVFRKPRGFTYKRKIEQA